jgi:hypothetical protein
MLLTNWLLAKKVEYVHQRQLLFRQQKSKLILLTDLISIIHENSKKLMVFAEYKYVIWLLVLNIEQKNNME